MRTIAAGLASLFFARRLVPPSLTSSALGASWVGLCYCWDKCLLVRLVEAIAQVIVYYQYLDSHYVRRSMLLTYH